MRIELSAKPLCAIPFTIPARAAVGWTRRAIWLMAGGSAVITDHEARYVHRLKIR